MKNILGIIAVIAICYGAYLFVSNSSENQKWTLMVCSSVMSDGVSCYDNSFEVPGYNSYAECFTAGSAYAESGFECGRGCKTDQYGLHVCKEICNADGCS